MDIGTKRAITALSAKKMHFLIFFTSYIVSMLRYGYFAKK